MTETTVWLTMEQASIAEDGPVTTKHGNVKDWMRRNVRLANGQRGIVRARSLNPPHATNLVYREIDVRRLNPESESNAR